MPPSDATSQYPPPSGVAAMPTMGLFSRMLPGAAVELGVAEAEDAAVGGHLPVPRRVVRRAMPTIGWFSRMPPVLP